MEILWADEGADGLDSYEKGPGGGGLEDLRTSRMYPK